MCEALTLEGASARLVERGTLEAVEWRSVECGVFLLVTVA